MVLVTHHLQGSKVTCPFRPLPWNKGLTLKRCVTTVHMVGRTDSCLSLKHNFSLSIGASGTHGLKVKHFKISAFKGSAKSDESAGRANGSKVPKNSVSLSYVPKESEEAVTEYTSETNENVTGSPAIQKLFKKWLTMLRTQLPSLVVDNVLEEPCTCENSEALTKTPSKEQSAEVSKELAPLWIFGPLVVALYIKLFKVLCALYAFTFKHTVNIVKNLPSYFLVAYEYLAKGKLKASMRAHVWQPIEDFKNMDYKEFSRRQLKVFQEWLMEKYIDYVESIWPFYCRTIRFLKRANLI
ncbi:hypothetical protein ACFE04_027339 [Oxalis oulophora]